MEKISDSETAKLLGIPIERLQLLEERGLLHSTQKTDGTRSYLTTEVTRLRSRRGFTLADEASRVNAALQRDTTVSISSLRKVFYALGTGVAAYCMLVIALAGLFAWYPVQTADWLGITPNVASSKSSKVIAAEKDSQAAKPERAVTIINTILRPAGRASLDLIKALSPTSYAEITKRTILDPNDILQANLDGTITPTQPLNISDSSLLKVTTTDVVSNLNATYIQGKQPGSNPGDLAIVGEIVAPVTSSQVSITNPIGSTNSSAINSTGSVSAAANFTGLLFGDVAGTQASTIVSKINGSSLGLTTPSASNLLIGDGTKWTTQALSNDATINSSGILTLKSVGTAGSYGSATVIPVITTDAVGRVMGVANTPISGLTVLGFASPNISQWTNNSGFITNSSTDTLTNKSLAAGSNTISGITVANLSAGDYSAAITSGTYGISITGNTATATALQTARTINAVSFDGTSNITVPAAAGTLTGGALAAGVTTSSLTSVGTLGSLVLSGAVTGATGYNGLVITPNTGAITTGTWNGTTIAVANGGTGTTNGSIAGTGALSLTSATTNILTLDSGTTGGISIGTGANAKTITVGNTTGATGVVVNSGTGNIILNGNVGVSTAIPTRNIDVTGNWGGNAVVDNQLLTASATVTESTKALAYHLTLCNVATTCSTGNGTQGSAPTVTFNITGLPDTDGTFAFIETQVQRIGVGGGANENSTIIVQINGSQISTNTTGANNADSAVLIENYTVIRSNGVWRVIGTPGTSDSADLAEWIPYTGETPIEGELVSVGTESGTVQRSGAAYDSHIVGVVATNPHTLMGTHSAKSIKLALAGRVPVKVSTENGPINIGDYLTSSSTPGMAMRASEAGMVIGQALSAFNGGEVGEVTVLIKNTYYPGEFSGSSGQQLFGDISLKVKADGSNNELSILVPNIQSEAPHDPMGIIAKKIADGKQFLTNFVAARITAIRGYFDEVFAKKVHTDKLCVNKTDGTEVCLDGDQIQNIVDNNQSTIR